MVTMMPDVAEKFRLARIVGVPFPFGHAFGPPGDVAMQREVSEAAVRLLAEATAPTARVDLDHLAWPQDDRTAYRDWQPSEASPIVRYNMERAAAAEARGTPGDGEA